MHNLQNVPVTIADAKTHWQTHTRKVLTDHALKLARQSTSFEIDPATDTAIVVLGAHRELTLWFRHMPIGSIYCSMDR